MPWIPGLVMQIQPCQAGAEVGAEGVAQAAHLFRA